MVIHLNEEKVILQIKAVHWLKIQRNIYSQKSIKDDNSIK